MEDPRAASRRGSYAKVLSRRGSTIQMDYKHPATLSVNTHRNSGSDGERDMPVSPRSPLANSSSIVFPVPHVVPHSNNNNNNNHSNGKVFRAIQGTEFAGISLPDEHIPPPNTNAPFAGIPVFLGPDGTLYDVNYVPVTAYMPKFDSNDPRSKSAFTPGAPIYSNFPEVENFENFFDYEQAVMDWKDSVLKHLGWLQLPTVLGRFYSRPRMTTDSRERRDSTTSSDSSFQDLIEDRTNIMGSSVESPPTENKYEQLNSMDAFEFVPSPLHDTVLNSISSTDSDGESGEFGGGLQQQMREIRDRAAEVLIELPPSSSGGDSPNDSGREDMPKSPRHIFRKSQSFSRGSGSPRKLSHRLSDPGELRAQMLEGFEESRWTYSRDPWESTLIPPEPQPSFYATYAEYEGAMKRWAKECCTKANYIPPHAHQLQDVIKLNPAVEQINERSNTVPEQGPVKPAQDLPAWKIKSGEIPLEILFPPIKRIVPEPVPSPPLPRPAEGRRPLNATSLRKLSDCLDTLGSHIDHEQGNLVRKFDILPTFAPNWKNSHQTKVQNHLIPELPLKAARRTDIFGELDMSPLQKDFPDPEIVLALPKLAPTKTNERERRDYTQQMKKIVQRLDNAFRYDNIYSSYAQSHAKDINQVRNEIYSWVEKGQITVDVVKRIFMSRMFVDKFKDFLGESVPNYFDSAQTFLNVFMDLLNGETFRTILELLENSQDDLIRGKISVFLNNVLSIQRGHTWVALIIENYVDHEDLESLYRFAMAANFLSPRSIDVFPCRSALFDPIVKKVFKGDMVKTIIDQVYMFYYLGIISSLSAHPDIIEWLDTKKKEVIDSLAENLQKDKNFLFIHLYTGLCHRSSTLSGLFLFVTVQLLHCYDVAIQKLLRSPDAGLVSNIKNLASSKFVHAQYAARRLFTILLDDPWRDFFLSETDKAKTFFEDLTASSAINPDAPSLLSTLMLTLVDDAMTNLPTNKDQLKAYPGTFLLSDSLFHKALNHITKAKALDATTEAVSAFLEKVSKTIYTHNLLEASDKLKQTTTKNKTDVKTQETVQITLADIQLITTFIHKVTANDKYTVRTNMLNCLRHLLQHSRTFELLKKETHIHLRLVAFCKDGRNLAFNKTAWKLFYQLIHYHKELLEQFEKSKVLSQFLDTIGPNSGNIIMMNSLHYTYKIFSLMDREADRIKAGKSVSRGGDAKSLEKDLKALSKIFVNSHLFIKIHMIYKRLINPPPPLQSTQGAPFIQLALLYHVIGKNPLYKKLYKDIQRNPEYKDGLTKLCNMFETTQTLTPSTFTPTPLASASMLGSSSTSLFELQEKLKQAKLDAVK